MKRRFEYRCSECRRELLSRFRSASICEPCARRVLVPAYRNLKENR